MKSGLSYKMNDILFYGLLLVTGIVYLFTFPQGGLISDEYTYINSALAIQNGIPYLGYVDPFTNEYFEYKNSHYTMGNAFWIALWTKCFGIKWAFLGSLFLLLGSMTLLYKSLRREGLFIPCIGLALLYPATLIFAHSFMSGMPSLGLVCLFIYLLFGREESAKKWFFLTFIAAFSFWFRETNVLLLGGICLVHFIQDRRWFVYYALGGIIGFLPRLISAWWAYDDPFYYILGAGFSFQNVLDNFVIYALLTVVLMPLGVVFLMLYKGRYRYPILLSILAFLLLYLLYGYNAIAYSGPLTGTIVMSRFLLPILPFYVISIGWFFRDVALPVWLIYSFYGVVFAVSIGVQIYMHREASLHASVANKIYENYDGGLVMFDHSGWTNVIRYVNPFYGSFKMQTDISRLADRNYMTTVFDSVESVTTLHTLNTTNAEKQSNTDKITDYLDIGLRRYSVIESDSILIKNDLQMVRLKLKR
jgi:hypothetical protein